MKLRHEKRLSRAPTPLSPTAFESRHSLAFYAFIIQQIETKNNNCI